jgi:energy-coupling factor transporter transmembrane protein EcfT
MRSAILRANPLAQLSLGMFSLLGSFWIDDLDVALLALAAYAAAAVLLLPGWRYPLVCLGFTSIAAVTIVYSTWRLGGHDVEEAFANGVRIVVLAWPGSVMAGYVDPTRLADYLAQSLRLPARLVAAFAAAMQRFTGFGLAWEQLDQVRRVRGVGRTRNPVSNGRYAASMTFALLVQAMRSASHASVAMDARGFATAHHRTWAEPADWTRLDVATVAAAAALGSVAPVLAMIGS